MNAAPRYAEVNAIRLAYDLAGHGYPMLLIHGFPRDRRLWRWLVPLLSKQFTMLMPDRRGYGESDRPADAAGYDNMAMAADMLALLDKLDWQKCLVVGHDLGAPVAQRLAADHPDRVAGLAILDGLPAGTAHQGPRDSTGRTWYLDFFRQRGVAEQIMGRDPRLFFSLFLDRNPHLTPEEHELFLEPFCRPGSVAAVLADYRHMLEDDRERWRAWFAAGNRIRVPVCALWGDRGPSAGAPVLEAWRDAALDVRGAAIRDSAHYVQEEQPEQVAHHLLAFAEEAGLK